MDKPNTNYKVELTEQEVRGIGVDRYARKHVRRKMVTFAIGLVLVCIFAYFWAELWGKVFLCGTGMVWLVLTYREAKKDGRAGKQFLEEVKNAQSDN